MYWQVEIRFSVLTVISLTVVQQQYSELSCGEVANNDVVRSGDWEELQRVSVGVVGRKISVEG